MERRLLLAVALCVVVIYVTPLLFPTPKPLGGLSPADSAAMVQAARAESINASSAPSGVQAPSGLTANVAAPSAAAAQTASAQAPPKVDTVRITTPNTIVTFSNVGAAPLTVTMRNYHMTVRNVQDRATSPLVRLGRPGDALLGYRIITPHDTLSLDHVAFSSSVVDAVIGSPLVTFSADVPGRSGTTWHVTIAYAFSTDGYLSKVAGSIAGFGMAPAEATEGTSYLLVTMPAGFPPVEADTLDDMSQLAYSYKREREDPSSVSFQSLKPGEPQLRPGPISWIAAKDKYFLVGILSADSLRPHQFAELDLSAVPNARAPGSKQVTSASAVAVLPMWPMLPGTPSDFSGAPQANQSAKPLATAPGGASRLRFDLELYMGPQEFRRLRALGRSFENLNPYGGIFRPILQPFVTLTLELLLWMRQVLRVNYGWVLVIFGIVIRVLLWPLNQRAMRSSLRMQQIQPQIAEVQAKHKNNPQKLQTEMMRVYGEHGMSPWSPIAGCLPMLLPTPFFAALYFVFRNTIEFRGVPFLWLHDISVRDPYYILPLLLGASSFLVSWIGMRNVPPNPQTKMMGYMFPLIMTSFFWKIAAGLNLYYFVQTLATIPQQWYIANERAKATGGGQPASGGGGGGGGGGSGGSGATQARARPSGGGGGGGGGSSVAAATSSAKPKPT
jgi:YidC/Oxa1 family membrane protein insertase